MNYIYILKCGDNTLYTGWTNDIENRLALHRSGRGAKYTRGRGPLELVYLEISESKEEAMRREFQIKQLPREDKLKLIENSDWKGQLESWSLCDGKILSLERCVEMTDKKITEGTIEKCMEKFMKEAIRQAKKARALDEVPIGCVIVFEGRIIARGYNRRNTDKNTLAHAELSAIKKASKKMGDWRLEGCTMYVTLEPCQMCAGALVQSRMDRVVIGCRNPKAGCAGSVMNLLQTAAFNHQVEIVQGVCEEECSALLRTFFSELREKKKAAKMQQKEL